MIRHAILAALLTSLTAAAAAAADAPAEIKLGTLYASSGRFASISMPVHYGLKLWIDQKNAEGGVYVKAFDKKIPLKLVAYDDQSNTATAATLYNQLITQDKVDILISDSGSVLTSVAVPIARDHKMFLFDQTGTGASFFTPDNPYIALMADPVSSIWPKPLADFITHDGPGLGIKRVAILYATNDFTGTQANAVRKFVKESNSGVEIVFDEGVPTETTNYTVLINNIRAANPDAVIHFGYALERHRLPAQRPGQSASSSRCCSASMPGIETELLEKNVGDKGAELRVHLCHLLGIRLRDQFRHDAEGFPRRLAPEICRRHVEFGFNSVAGYTTGLVLEKTLSVATSLDQLELRKAVFSLSGNLKTLDGTFELDPTGGADRRNDPARAACRRRSGSPEVHHRLSARGGDRQAGLSAPVTANGSAEPGTDRGGALNVHLQRCSPASCSVSISALVGIGLNLVFGVMRIVNLAHGDFLMLGAFLAFWLFTLFASIPCSRSPLAFVIFALVGVLLY